MTRQQLLAKGRKPTNPWVRFRAHGRWWVGEIIRSTCTEQKMFHVRTRGRVHHLVPWEECEPAEAPVRPPEYRPSPQLLAERRRWHRRRQYEQEHNVDLTPRVWVKFNGKLNVKPAGVHDEQMEDLRTFEVYGRQPK